MNTYEIDKKYVANTYNRFPVNIVSGKGSICFDENGKRYIDLGSGIGVTAFGLCDDVWADAVTKQVNTLQHTSNLYYTDPCAKLAQMLCEKTGLKKVFFANSGAEANECAIKVARKYASDKKGEEYYNIITLVNSFHGRTVTTLAATGQEHYHELFQPLTNGFLHTPANDIDALCKMVAENKTAAIMIECVQGEGGVIALDSDFVQAVYKICQENDILMIVDEVQTGNGRTGKMYAYMNFGVSPDIVTTAKGLGGGLPIGACMLGEKTENVLGFGDHGSTYGGNPVCSAGAVSVIERLDDAFLAEVKEKGEFIFDFFKGVEGVEGVSGLGMMVGVKTKANASDIVKKCMEKGVLLLTAKDKVRLLPALNIPKDVLKEALEIIKSVIEEMN